jgi:hypothetical protein
MTTNRETFYASYLRNLTKAVSERPDVYTWPVSELDTVFARMIVAIERGSYNKDGLAFKFTCKELGITHTYKAINAYLEG